MLVIESTTEEETQAELILGKVVSLGRRYHPSESAFPLREFLIVVGVLRIITNVSFRSGCGPTCSIFSGAEWCATIWMGAEDIGAVWRLICRYLGHSEWDV